MIKNINQILDANKYLLSHRQNFNEEVGLAIKRIRNNNNISIKDFSNIIFTSESYVCQIEHGINGLSLLKFIMICNALDIKSENIVDEFLFNQENGKNVLVEKLQEGKNISNNILNYIKSK